MKKQSTNLDRFQVKAEQVVLENGLKIVHFEKKGAPITIKFQSAAGSRFDKIEGTAHFLEHMLVSGTEKFPSKDKLAIYIENTGGRFSAATNIDSLSISISLADKEDINAAARLLDEMLFHSLLKPKIIETERGSILRELSNQEANPSSMIIPLAMGLFFQQSGINTSIIGTKESIKTIKQNDLRDFYNQNILSGQAVLTSAGDIPLKTLREEIGPILLKIKYEQKFPNKNMVQYSGQRTAIHHYPTEQTQLIYGFRTVAYNNPDSTALIFLGQILGGGRASRLAKRLRYDKGLVYAVSPFIGQLCDGGIWCIETASDRFKVQEVVDIIKEEVSRLAEEKIGEEELEFNKNRIIKLGKLALQTSESWVNFHGSMQFYSDTLWTIENYFSEIKAMKAETLQQSAKKYFDLNNSYLAMCGNTEADKVKI